MDVTTWHVDVVTNSATFVVENTKIVNAQEMKLHVKSLNEKELSKDNKLNDKDNK